MTPTGSQAAIAEHAIIQRDDSDRDLTARRRLHLGPAVAEAAVTHDDDDLSFGASAQVIVKDVN